MGFARSALEGLQSRVVKIEQFSPPNAEQVEAHLQSHRLRGPSRMMAWLPLILMVVVLALWSKWPALWLGPWLVLFILLMAANLRARSIQRMERLTQQAQGLALFRRYPDSLRVAWRSLPTLVSAAPLHRQAVACIAHNLDELSAYAAAIVAYDYLIDNLPAGEPLAVEYQIHRATALIAVDRLTDADEALRRLRHAVSGIEHGGIGAAYRLARLAQQVRTGHYDAAVEDAESLFNTLRPLGIRAGYGHALAAFSYHQLGRFKQADTLSHVDLWWSRATLLLTPQAIVQRFPDLEPMLGAAVHSDSAVPPPMEQA